VPPQGDQAASAASLPASQANLAQSDTARATGNAQSRRYAPTDGQLPTIEISVPAQFPQAIDLTAEANDLFERMRKGFSMPNISNDLVLYHQQWYLNRPDYLRRTVERSSLGARVQAALDALAKAYAARAPQAFMALVAPGFTPDAMVLDRAVRRDFQALDSIELNLRAASVVQDADGKAQAVVSYSRRVVAAKGGKAYADQGSTQLTLVQAGSGLLVQAMRLPLIFGISLPEDVSTGGRTPPNAIQVREDGSVDQGTSQPVQPRSVHLACEVVGCQPPIFFNFASGQVDGADGDFKLIGQTELDQANIEVVGSVTYAELGSVDLASVGKAPADGWQGQPGIPVGLKVGQCYAFSLTGSRYAVIRVTAVVGLGTPNPASMDFDYLYQGDGTGVFK